MAEQFLTRLPGPNDPPAPSGMIKDTFKIGDTEISTTQASALLPGITPQSAGIAEPLTAINALLEDDEDDDYPDTTGFYYNDENIFETGGLNKSDHRKVLRHPALPGAKKTIKMPVNKTRPGDEFLMNGEYYEFLGYMGDPENLLLSDEEISSFEGEGEFSDFKFLKKLGKGIGKAFKKIGKSGLGKGLLAGLVPGAGLALGATALFRKRRKTVRFDGYAEYEYFIGPSPEFSDFKFLKKIGKAIGKAGKAVGKGVGKAAKAVGKGVKNAVRATGKGIGNATKFVVNTAGALIAPQQQPYVDPGTGLNPVTWSQQQAAMEPGYTPEPTAYSAGDGTYDGTYGPEYGIGGSNYQPTYQANEPTPAKNNTVIYIALAVVVALAAFLIYKQSKK